MLKEIIRLQIDGDINAAKNYIDKPFYKEFAHHVTLLHRSQYKPHLDFLLEKFNLLKGETFPIIISEIGISDKAVAFKVEGCSEFCCNFIPHVTVGTFEGGKPVDSNNNLKGIVIDPGHGGY